MDTTEIKNTEPFKITGNWDYQSKQLKEKFPQLTEADLTFETGKEDEMLTRIATKLNKNREELISVINQDLLEKV